MTFLDTPERYGLVSRLLHWSIAALLIWQVATILAWRLVGPTALVKTVTSFGPYHGTVGALTFGLALFRACWALRFRHRRPVRAKGVSGWAAGLVHGAFYVLMIAVPGLALLRAYGNGKGYELWGASLLPATGRETAWMTAIADALHGPLAWTFFVLIAGHVAMALAHRFVRHDGVLRRMA